MRYSEPEKLRRTRSRPQWGSYMPVGEAQYRGSSWSGFSSFTSGYLFDGEGWVGMGLGGGLMGYMCEYVCRSNVDGSTRNDTLSPPLPPPPAHRMTGGSRQPTTQACPPKAQSSYSLWKSRLASRKSTKARRPSPCSTPSSCSHSGWPRALSGGVVGRVVFGVWCLVGGVYAMWMTSRAGRQRERGGNRGNRQRRSVSTRVQSESPTRTGCTQRSRGGCGRSSRRGPPAPAAGGPGGRTAAALPQAPTAPPPLRPPGTPPQTRARARTGAGAGAGVSTGRKMKAGGIARLRPGAWGLGLRGWVVMTVRGRRREKKDREIQRPNR